MSPRPATDIVIPGVAALAVGNPGTAEPEGWQWTRLMDVARLESGHTPSRKHPEYWGGGVPWVSLPDARQHHGRVIRETTQTTNEKGLANSAARLLPTDTVCLSRTASVGYVFRMGRPMATSQDFVNWVCSAEALDPRFLMYALMAEGDHILDFGRGTTHTTIYFPEVQAFHLCLAPLAEQRRIVAKVEALLAEVTAVRERLANVPAILKRFRQSVLAAACSGRLTEEWRIAHPVEEDAKKLVARIEACRAQRAKRRHPLDKGEEPSLEAPSGDLPAGWEWFRISDVATVCLGGTPSRKESRFWGGTIPWVSSGEVANCRISATREAITKAGLENCNAKLYPPRSVLIAMIGEGKTRGQAALLEIEACTNQNVAGLVFEAGTIQPEYVWLWALSEYENTRGEGRGGNQSALNGSKVRALPIPVPPVAEQVELVRRVDVLFKVADAVEKHVAAATARAGKTTQAILAKAFRGELVPTEAEVAREEGRDYEPASLLVERVAKERASQGGGGPKKRCKRVAA